MTEKSKTRQLSLDERKTIMLEIMQDLKQYFDKHDLKYCLIGGTLIGAIRHKGFIPWDDDMDIAMPFDDYMRLIKLSEKESISDDVYLSTPYTNKDHVWPMTKAISRKTSLIESIMLDKYVERQKRFFGIYVDIFPIYGLPDSKIEREAHSKHIVRLYNWMRYSSRLVLFQPGYGSLFRKIIYNICFIPFRIIGIDYFIQKLLKAIEKYPYKIDGYCGFALGIVKNGKDINRTNLFVDTIEVPFETLFLKIPKEYDKILQKQFGNYMLLPPVDQRRVHVGIATYREED